MTLILSDIHSLRQHINTLKTNPELYCPDACIYCQETVIWRYGYYYRKPDRLASSKDSLNDVPIPRFKCVSCCRTFSTLPECIAPRRWYPWVLQQLCLYLSLSGYSIKTIHQHIPAARSTLSRWVRWLNDKFIDHHRGLCSEVAAMGYYSDYSSFWLHWFKSNCLSHAMLLLNRQGVSVP